MPKIEAFEQFSDAYEEWFERNPEVYEAELDVIRQLLPSPAAEGMEVGVGSGKFALPLGIRVGVEPSRQMAIKAEQRGIHVFPGVAEDLPFPNDRFGFVLMVTTICFVDDVNRAFREAFRVLKPGGCLVVGFVDKDSQLGRQYAEKRQNSKFYREAIFYSAREVLRFLNETGFGAMEIKQILVPGESQGTIMDGYGKGSFVAIRGVKAAGGPV
ncbi:MAG: class I SAM-dependent methyltransferase [Thermodesulfobacteriota bacterium]